MITFTFRMKLFPKCFEPLWLVWLCGEVVSIVDTDLHHGRHVLEGSEGHDGAKYWVSSEENKLRVWCEAVVDFVPKSCIVPKIPLFALQLSSNTSSYLFTSLPISGGISIQRLSSSSPISRAMLYMFLTCSSSSDNSLLSRALRELSQ